METLDIPNANARPQEARRNGQLKSEQVPRTDAKSAAEATLKQKHPKSQPVGRHVVADPRPFRNQVAPGVAAQSLEQEEVILHSASHTAYWGNHCWGPHKQAGILEWACLEGGQVPFKFGRQRMNSQDPRSGV